jgi:hypothetical protein
METQLAYLAGLIDGEGTIGLSEQISKPGWKNKGACHIRSQVDVVTNTNAKLIEAVADMLKSLGVGFIIVEFKVPAKCRQAWKVALVKIDDKKKLLELVQPYLVAKREQCDLVLKFLKPRNSSRKVKTTPEERLLMARCHELNQRGLSETVTTVREVPEREMIQSELHGDMQRSAEMTDPGVFKN